MAQFFKQYNDRYIPILSNNYLKYKWLIKKLYREKNPILYVPQETLLKVKT